MNVHLPTPTGFEFCSGKFMCIMHRLSSYDCAIRKQCRSIMNFYFWTQSKVAWQKKVGNLIESSVDLIAEGFSEFVKSTLWHRLRTKRKSIADDLKALCKVQIGQKTNVWLNGLHEGEINHCLNWVGIFACNERNFLWFFNGNCLKFWMKFGHKLDDKKMLANISLRFGNVGWNLSRVWQTFRQYLADFSKSWSSFCLKFDLMKTIFLHRLKLKSSWTCGYH